VPNVFGMNFQSVSVGQKLAKSGLLDPAGLMSGYLDAKATPGNALTLQLAYVDDARWAAWWPNCMRRSLPTRRCSS